MLYLAQNNQQPLFQSGGNVGFNGPSNFCSPAVVNNPWPGNSGVRESDVARSFLNNFTAFEAASGGSVTLRGLQHYASRSEGGDEAENQLIQLARNIVGSIRGGVGLDVPISRENVMSAITFFEGKESATGYGGGMQMSPRPDYGAMQQQRINSQYFPQYAVPPQMQNNSGYFPQTPQIALSVSTPSTPTTDGDFVAKLNAHFSSLEDPSTPGSISDKSLASVISGRRMDGTPATPEEMQVAQELKTKFALFNQLDQNGTGKLDGRFSRDDIARVSDHLKAAEMSDAEVIDGMKKFFVKYGGGDEYVNKKELEQAAGKAPSDREYTAEERQAAIAILNRPALYKELDLGTNGEGGRGYKDDRFDMANVEYMQKQLNR